MATKKIEEIKTHATFESLFTINDELLAKIEQDMRDENYDESQPIMLATWEGQEEPVCIDGHTRLKAASNAGIEEIPIYSYEFETEEDAFEYAVRLQSNRRNLTDGDLIHCIERLHECRPRGGDRRSENAKESTPQSCGNENGRSAGAKRTADLLNMSPRKVEQALTIINHGSPEVKEAVLKNEISINKAYEKTQAKRKQTVAETSTENTDDKVTDENQEVEQRNDGECSRVAAVLISLEQFGALHELGGSVEDHAAQAIKRYLESFQEQHEENLTDKGKDDDEDEWFYPEECPNEQGSEERLENAAGDNEDGEHNEEEADDDEEYLCLDEYA